MSTLGAQELFKFFIIKRMIIFLFFFFSCSFILSFFFMRYDDCRRTFEKWELKQKWIKKRGNKYGQLATTSELMFQMPVGLFPCCCFFLFPSVSHPLFSPLYPCLFHFLWCILLNRCNGSIYPKNNEKKSFIPLITPKKQTIFPFILPTKFLFPAICNLGNINSGISSRFCNSWNCNTVDFAFPDSAPPKPAFSYLSSSRRTWHTHKD